MGRSKRFIGCVCFVMLFAAPAHAQLGWQPNGGPMCVVGGNCEPGSTNLDGSPAYQPRPDPYVPYPTAVPYSPPPQPQYQPINPYQPAPSNPFAAPDDDNN